MMSTLLRYVPFLLSLLGWLGILSIVTLLANELLSQNQKMLLRSVLGMSVFRLANLGIKAIPKLSLILIGCGIGYLYAQVQANNRLVTRTNLTVIHRSIVDPSLYEFRNTAGEHFSLKFKGEYCHYVPNFDKGITLTIAFEDFGSCQSLDSNKTWFLVDRDKEQQPVIAKGDM